MVVLVKDGLKGIRSNGSNTEEFCGGRLGYAALDDSNVSASCCCCFESRRRCGIA